MRLYIANATQHVQSFLYRIPEVATVRHQHIPIGSQICLPEDLSSEHVDAVISQHARYGLVSVDNVSSIKEFVGLCYSVDKPVPAIKIERLMQHNREELVDLGIKLRQEAAITTNNFAEEKMEDTGAPTALRNLQVEIIEENPDPRNETAPIAEGYRLRREGENQFGPNKGQQQGRRRR